MLRQLLLFRVKPFFLLLAFACVSFSAFADEGKTHTISGTARDGKRAATKTLTLRYQTAGAVNAEAATVDCAVAKSSHFRCAIPAAGKVDLRFQADQGAAPQYRWGVDSSSASSDVGELIFTPGGSVSGNITIDSGDRSLKPEKIDVRLVPAITANGGPEADRSIRTFTGTTNSRGFFQFVGVPAGNYTVIASKSGWSPAYAVGVVVAGAREQVLNEPLVLQRLTAFEAYLVPPTAPSGDPWQVTLKRHSPLSRNPLLIASAPALDTGVWRREALESGSYVIEIKDRGTTFRRDDIIIRPRDVPLTINITAVEVEGRIQAGDEPVPAHVELYSPRGGRLKTDTDDSGVFRGVISQEGNWTLELTLRKSRQTLRRKVEIRRRDGEERARLDVALPAGRISGNVVNEMGGPVKAGVGLSRNGVPISEVVTAEDGLFEIIGIDEGPAVIQARQREAGESGAVPISVGDDDSKVTLTLRKETKLTGLVTTSDGQGVAGAKITFGSPETVYRMPTESSPTGRFELELPATADTVSLTVVAPGLATKMVTVPIDRESKRLDVIMTPVAGSLLIRVGSTPPWPFVAHGGFVASILNLMSFSGPWGGGAPEDTREGILLRLEPGEYRVCPAMMSSDKCAPAKVMPGVTAFVDARTFWPRKSDQSGRSSK